MRPEDLKAVRALPLFASMRQDSFEQLLPASFLQRFPKGVTLITEGDPADFLHVVVEGAVELYATQKRQESAVLVARPVSTFILAAVLRDAVYLMSARTLESSRILMIPSESIRTVVLEDTAFAEAMIAELAQAFRFMVKTVKNLKLRTAVERLANYLLRLRIEAGGAAAFSLPYEKRMVASLLGMTPENLSRAFATLKPYGVNVDGPQVTLTKLEDLERLAKPSPLIDDHEI